MMGWLTSVNKQMCTCFGSHAKVKRQSLCHSFHYCVCTARRLQELIWCSPVSKGQKQRKMGNESACGHVLCSTQTSRWFGIPPSKLQWRLRKLIKPPQTAVSFWIRAMCVNVSSTLHGRGQWYLHPNHWAVLPQHARYLRDGWGKQKGGAAHCMAMFYHLFSTLPHWAQRLLTALRCLFKSHQFKRVIRGCI